MEKMSKAELESICRTRGFELVNETDTSGNLIEYLHHDNIEAAQQCLAIEAEMDEILHNDPDLLSDIENEAEKMRLEQRRLEEEIAEMQVKLDEEREKAGEKVKGAFFKIQEEAGEEFEDGTGVEEEIRMDTIDGDNVETIDLDEEQFSTDKTKAPKNEIEHSQVTSKKNSFLDSKEIMSEFRNQVKNDVHNLIGFIFPKPIRDPLIGALRPVIRIVKNAGINTYDLLKRYVTVTVDKNGESNAPEEGIKV